MSQNVEHLWTFVSVDYCRQDKRYGFTIPKRDGGADWCGQLGAGQGYRCQAPDSRPAGRSWLKKNRHERRGIAGNPTIMPTTTTKAKANNHADELPPKITPTRRPASWRSVMGKTGHCGNGVTRRRTSLRL